MIIDTRTNSGMKNSICEYFNINNEALERILNQVYQDNDKYVNYDIIDKFVLEHKRTKCINKVYFFHISRRLNGFEKDLKGYTLLDLLVNKNILSDFLKKYDIEFKKVNEYIRLYYRGNEILVGGDCYLRKRLGYNEKYNDNCFNGFLIKEGLYNNYYLEILKDGPEFIS